jgi:hypothetical protein
MRYAGLVLLSLFGAYGFAPPIGEPSGQALAYAVTLRSGGSDFGGVGRCTRLGRTRWTCAVWDAGRSGTETYRITAEGHQRCFRGRHLGPYGGEIPHLKATVEGCVALRHQLRLVHRLLD